MSDRLDSNLINNDSEIDGTSLLTTCLSQQGIRYMFGVIGIPIVEVGISAQQTSGLTFYSFRNEQSSSYATSIMGYLTGYPAACLCVSGPGVIHSLAGIGNAWANRWPMILIAAQIDSQYIGRGGFQEAPQWATISPYIKYAAHIARPELIPIYVERAVRESIYGRPGPVYIELPTEFVHHVMKKKDIQYKHRCPSPPTPIAQIPYIESTLSLIRSASRPLLIIGKGAAYARAEHTLNRLVDIISIPFLPTPMGKGVISDDHPLCVSAARSHALQHADVILIVGARLNWILHFGSESRYDPNVKIIQIDIAAEELGNGRDIAIGLCGDATGIIQQCVDMIHTKKIQFPTWKEWKQSLHSVVSKNELTLEQLMKNHNDPITYYRAFAAIKATLPASTIIVTEGANTMDIGRTILSSHQPRSRLDAGTFATMGIGVGYSIAAAVAVKSGNIANTNGISTRVVAIEGDSAFGFSAMDYETAVRYQLPITFIIFNNSGVYYGADDKERQKAQNEPLLTPITALSYQTRYDQLATIFGGQSKGWLVTKSEELESTLSAAFSWISGPSIVNIIIQSQQGRRPQTHSWMSVGKSKL